MIMRKCKVVQRGRSKRPADSCGILNEQTSQTDFLETFASLCMICDGDDDDKEEAMKSENQKYSVESDESPLQQKVQY